MSAKMEPTQIAMGKFTVSANTFIFASVRLQATMFDGFVLSAAARSVAATSSTGGTSVTPGLASLVRIYFPVRKF
jgi:hypothetical protein